MKNLSIFYLNEILINYNKTINNFDLFNINSRLPELFDPIAYLIHDTNFTHQTAHQLVRSLDYQPIRPHDYKLTNLTIDRDNFLISCNLKPDDDIIYSLQGSIIHDSLDNRLNTEAGALFPKEQTKSIQTMNELNFFYTNATSLRNKWEELHVWRRHIHQKLFRIF